MAKKKPFIGCQVKQLPEEHLEAAAMTAIDINPSNRPVIEGLSLSMLTGIDFRGKKEEIAPAEFLAVLTSKYWGPGGVKLSVSFMETTAPELRDRIIGHMNAWGQYCNAHFVWSQSAGDVRISRGPGGYWSYLGTDIRHIPAGQPTMNLEGFVLNTSESEYKRVVRHETGHTLGYPHEHMRKQLIDRLNVQKTLAYFLQTQGWNETTTRQQVLTPVNESSIMGTVNADEDSIMCYQLPGDITIDGKPIRGGIDIEAQDEAFAAKIYPLVINPPPLPTDGGTSKLIITFDGLVKNPKIVAG